MKMRAFRNTKSILKRFRRSEDGVALVEFAIVLPMMLLVFAVIIEGGTLLVSYQSAITGVRDATRYLSRVVPVNVCSSGGSVAAHTGKLTSIVNQTITGGSVFATGVTVNSVTPTLACNTGTYRASPVGIATVTANVTVTYPFAGVFSLFGFTLSPVTTNVTDSARIFGT